ncbi:2212_t:CDS:2 [Racocetra fulgida]|uniref:2212_t:CDS:1 n=1 Tax=Racocetra fulgida TaxID=60492 RepID=A0A9N9CC00_9GLOM|nr:2212_t:CDS:2 [Racocetra fulgida]
MSSSSQNIQRKPNGFDQRVKIDERSPLIPETNVGPGVRLNDIIEIKTFSAREAIYLLKKAFPALWAFLFLQALQGYTSGNPKMAGIYTQRAIIIMMLGFIPIGIIWLVSENILINLGQDAELSHYAAFKDWSTFMKLALPGMLTSCADWWIYELIALFAGYFGSVSLASHRLILTIALILYQIPHSLAVAASNRVGNLLGAGLPNRATIATNTSLILAVIGSGVLRGQGRLKTVAAIFLPAFYLIGLPLGLMSAFEFNMGLKGLWSGVTCASICMSIGIVLAVSMTDWSWEVEECHRRVKNELIDEDVGEL